MSGGHFNYLQSKIDEVADNLMESEYRELYSPETLKKIALAAETLSMAAKMLQRVDYLVCGDDGEISFNARWVEDGCPLP